MTFQPHFQYTSRPINRTTDSHSEGNLFQSSPQGSADMTEIFCEWMQAIARVVIHMRLQLLAPHHFGFIIH
jgi:hypothetical protein